MNEDKFTKLEAHTDTLLTLLIRSHSQYLYLRPMMFNPTLIARYGSSPEKRRGFEQLRHVLYWNLVLEIVKLCDDQDRRSPSISGLRAELESSETVALLRTRYTRSQTPGSDDIAKQLQAREITEAEEGFEVNYSKFMADSQRLLTGEEFTALKRGRDKHVAHNELRFINGEYEFAPIEDLKFGYERKTLEAALGLIAQLSSIIRQASFAWNTFYETEVNSVCAFWDIDALGDPIQVQSK